MKKQDLERLAKLETRILQIAEEEGLAVRETIFEVVPARRMLEAMAYMFPVNFSHWSFGRDYDYHRTIYDHSGAGIPYEQVWNFDVPKALLVETNPFALNVLTMAHVVGHVDFFLRNHYTRHGRSFANIAEEARFAAERFQKYESKYGEDKVEAIIDAGMSLRWHQPHDPLFEEPADEQTREYIIRLIQEKIRYEQRRAKEAGGGSGESEAAIKALELELARARRATPPEPVHDILKYIMARSSRLRKWERDILSVIWNQARALAPNARTKMLNEGWATYWHTRIMRRLFQEGLLSAEEHGVFLDFHNKVTQQQKSALNVYSVGPAIFEYAEEVWNRGRFGMEFEECRDPRVKAEWNTHAMKGKEKIFQISASYTDHMAVMELFTPEFIHGLSLYIYEERLNEERGEIEYVILEKNAEIIRQILMRRHAFLGMPEILVVNGNYNNHGEMYLRHEFDGLELEDVYTRETLRNTFYAWGRPVHLETVVDEKPTLYTFDGNKISVKTDDEDEWAGEDFSGIMEI